MKTSDEPILPAEILAVIPNTIRHRDQTTSRPASIYIPTAKRYKPLPSTDYLYKRYIIATADYMTNRFTTGQTAQQKATFRAARITELKSAQFPATWWKQHNPVNSRAEYATPIEEPDQYPNPQTPPSSSTPPIISNYDKPSAFYAIPTWDNPLPEPPPGWHHTTTNGKIHDTYHVQARYDIPISPWVQDAYEKPIWIRCPIEIRLTSPYDAHYLWQQVAISYQPNINWPNPTTANAFQVTFLKQQYHSPAAPIIPASPFALTWNTTLIFPVGIRKSLALYTEITRLSVIIAPIPPHGRYHRNNAWGHCELSAAPTVHTIP